VTTSFQNDILPMFTQTDIDHMSQFNVILNDYSYMSQPDNAANVYTQVSQGSMPPPPSEGGETSMCSDVKQLVVDLSRWWSWRRCVGPASPAG
jgi:hypothetical protein